MAAQAAAAAAAVTPRVALSGRRMALTCGAVGAAAGCMGTWFEMSHAVVCVPVVTLPPLSLSHHVAVGSTIFGVAARQLLAATLYALEPGNSITLESLEEIIDIEAATVLAASGTCTAFGAANFTARLSSRHLRKANGAFMVGVAVFLYWRELKIRAATEARETTAEANAEANEAARAEEEGTTGERTAAPVVAHPPVDASRWLPENRSLRLLLLGSAAGTVLGGFGIGAAWMIAPILTHTASPAEQEKFSSSVVRQVTRTMMGPEQEHADEYDPGLSASDQKLRSTACFAMVPPSLAAAWRHMQLGNVPNLTGVALPLAAGAVLGSYIAGIELVEVPCEEEVRAGLSLLLFFHGSWTFFKF